MMTIDQFRERMATGESDQGDRITTIIPFKPQIPHSIAHVGFFCACDLTFARFLHLIDRTRNINKK